MEQVISIRTDLHFRKHCNQCYIVCIWQREQTVNFFAEPFFPAEKEVFLKSKHFTGGCQFQLIFFDRKNV